MAKQLPDIEWYNTELVGIYRLVMDEPLSEYYRAFAHYRDRRGGCECLSCDIPYGCAYSHFYSSLVRTATSFVAENTQTPDLFFESINRDEFLRLYQSSDR